MAILKTQRPLNAATLRPVIQQEITGCAIASVAALAGTSYARAKRVANGAGIYAENPQLWADTAPMRRLLALFALRAVGKRQFFRGWHRLPDFALLAIKWHIDAGRPCWHWVVYARDRSGGFVLDSKKSLRRHRRNDFGRMKPKWYLEVRVKK